MLKLLKQKGVHPYEYMNSFEMLSDDKLPVRLGFFSSLKSESICEKDYLHAADVWIMSK